VARSKPKPRGRQLVKNGPLLRILGVAPITGHCSARSWYLSLEECSRVPMHSESRFRPDSTPGSPLAAHADFEPSVAILVYLPDIPARGLLSFRRFSPGMAIDAVRTVRITCPVGASSITPANHRSVGHELETACDPYARRACKYSNIRSIIHHYHSDHEERIVRSSRSRPTASPRSSHRVCSCRRVMRRWRVWEQIWWSTAGAMSMETSHGTEAQT